MILQRQWSVGDTINIDDQSSETSRALDTTLNFNPHTGSI